MAWSVGGFSNVGLLAAWLFLALTAAMSAAVASTCANGDRTLQHGRYRTLIPVVVGSLCHAVVSFELHVWASERVSTSNSRGDRMSVLQHKSA